LGTVLLDEGVMVMIVADLLPLLLMIDFVLAFFDEMGLVVGRT